MAHKYRFDPKTIRVEIDTRSTFRKIVRIFSFILPVAVCSIGFLHIQDHKIDTPGVQKLLNERSAIQLQLNLLEREIDRMENDIYTIQIHDDNLYRPYFEVSPLSASLRNAGFGGTLRDDIFHAHSYSDQLAKLDKNLDKISKKLVVQSQSFDEVIEMARTKEKRIAARPAIQPISIKKLTRFGSAFGMRFHPILKKRRMHEGIDLTAPRGTEIFATADGVVLQAGYTTGGYGNKILIDHGFGYRTLYGHCSKVIVKKGQKVKRGDVVGLVGSTGLSVSPHLHYEVHLNGRPRNPVHYYANDLSAEEYDRMIELLSQADPGFDIN